MARNGYCIRCIDRAKESTRKWLDHGGLEQMAIPPQMQPYARKCLRASTRPDCLARVERPLLERVQVLKHGRQELRHCGLDVHRPWEGRNALP